MSTLAIEEPVCNFTRIKVVQGLDPASNIKTALGTIVYEQLPPVIQAKKIAEPVISKLRELPISHVSIHRTQQGELWICEFYSRVPIMINTDGYITTLALDDNIHVYNICVDPVTDQLYCTQASDTSIRTTDTQSGKTTKLFTTQMHHSVSMSLMMATPSLLVQLVNLKSHYMTRREHYYRM